jgi:23S rRNA (adenine1618-N6)-methyltransferase
MLPKKKEHPAEKTKLHARNKHRERYDFAQLIASCPALATFVQVNPFGDESIDFFNPAAVKMLNKALLQHFYTIQDWDVPANYLCPPIPGRADYIHHLADLMAAKNNGIVPNGNGIKCLDIGVGASCVYPIVGQHEYGWSFVGAEIDSVSITSANKIIESNPQLKDSIAIRLQKNAKNIFLDIIENDEMFDAVICNPPFHASQADADAGSLRKLSNLQNKRIDKPTLNFGGQNAELWCAGGEVQFVTNMIYQSKLFAHSCFWFSSLIAKQTHLKAIYAALEKASAYEVQTIAMGQGNKTSRIVAWTFLTKTQQEAWRQKKWNS